MRVVARLLVVVGVLAGAVTLPRITWACSCGQPSASFWPPLRHAEALPASLPLVVAAPSAQSIRIESARGTQIPWTQMLELPHLGLCTTPSFVIAPAEDALVPGTYRLVTVPDPASPIPVAESSIDFAVVAVPLQSVATVLSARLVVEAHEPMVPTGSLCADRKIEGRAFSQTARVTLSLSTANTDVIASVAIADPMTPGGLGTSVFLRSGAQPTADALVQLPIEDGADPCVQIGAWDRGGTKLLEQTLCPTEGNDAVSVPVAVAMPAAILIMDSGCSCSSAGRRSAPQTLWLLAVASVLVLCRPRRRCA